MNRNYAVYALKRLFQAVVVILLVYVFTFVVISVLPGDPVTNTLRNPENGFSEADITRLAGYYGLDRPVYVQLGEALSRFVAGDLGLSLRSGLPVSRMIGEVLPSTLVLASSALALALVLALAIGFGSQYLPRRYGQGLLRTLPSLFSSVPTFVIGLVLINVFAFQLGLFRVIDADGGPATFFAALALSVPVAARIAEVLVASLDHEGRQEYVALARSRGLGHARLLLRHLLKPSSLPVVSVIAVTVGELLGSTVITEMIFGRVGVGTLLRQSATTQDLPALQAIVTLAAVVFVVVNLLSDLVYPLLDPRVKLAGRREKAEVAA